MKLELMSRLRRGSVSGLLAALLGVGGGGCSGVNAERDAADGVLGEFQIYVGYTEDQLDSPVNDYRLETPDGDSYELLFEEPPDFSFGTRVLVRGLHEGQAIRVDSIESLDREIATEQQRIDPKPLDPPLKIAMIILNASYTIEKGKKRLNDDFDSFRNYYLDSSYGIWTTIGDAFGPYTGVDQTGCEGSVSKIATAGRAAATAAGVNINDFKQHFFMLEKGTSCQYSGYGMGGTPPAQGGGGRGKVAKDTWYWNSDGCTVINQEPSHNYGLAHTHFCPSLPASTLPTKSCSGFQEYGDPFTTVSRGCSHLNGHEMAEMSFIDGCNMIDVLGSGTYEIGPIAKVCKGPQVIRVKEGDLNITVEYRIKTGIDSKHKSIPATGGILFHLAGDYKKGSFSKNEQFLIDPAGGSENAKALVGTGVEYKSPSGTVFKVDSVGETAKITVTVTGGGTGATCMDGKELGDQKAPSCRDLGTGGTSGTGGTGGSSGGSGGTAGVGTGGATGGTGATGGLTGGTGGKTGGVGGAGSGAGGGTGGGAVTGGTSGIAGKSGGGASGATSTGEENGGGCGCRVPANSRNSPTPFGLLATAGLSLLVYRELRGRGSSSKLEVFSARVVRHRGRRR